MNTTPKKKPARGRNRQPSVSRPRETAAALNRAEAVKLKVAGKSYREIGERLGVSHTAARDYVVEELTAAAEAARAAAGALRELEVSRIERLLEHWMPVATSDDPLSAKGAEIVLKASTRLAALYGLDAPTKQQHTGTVGLLLSPDLSQAIADARAARLAQEVPSSTSQPQPASALTPTFAQRAFLTNN